ncbi:FUN14 domain-containing protein 1-like isoform X2 [Dipodomys spectabilis]|uniref:FUN14 domain-containing protein 1-like isoform X2 n=1 Tax=Dipodomys spectabilis TaxID=105255 RepID=UPI001C53D87C|nr:FUN14 domain-containing protein 1-like isoform X2 [Dipodomys spectabilis]
MVPRKPPEEDEGEDDAYELLDLTECVPRRSWWNRVFGHRSGPMVDKYSVATRIVLGGVTGWCAGFLFQKVGKLAATAVGGGFLLLQIASHKATEFLKQNMVVSTGFVGGFFIGLAS